MMHIKVLTQNRASSSRLSSLSPEHHYYTIEAHTMCVLAIKKEYLYNELLSSTLGIVKLLKEQKHLM
jgi:hypothetical protein